MLYFSLELCWPVLPLANAGGGRDPGAGNSTRGMDVDRMHAEPFAEAATNEERAGAESALRIHVRREVRPLERNPAVVIVVVVTPAFYLAVVELELRFANRGDHRREIATGL